MIKILAIDEAELTAQVSSMIRLKKSENQVLVENERLEERKQAEEALRESEKDTAASLKMYRTCIIRCQSMEPFLVSVLPSGSCLKDNIVGMISSGSRCMNSTLIP